MDGAGDRGARASADSVTRAISPDDASVVAACLGRTPGAWDAFVDRFGGLLFHVADRTARQRGIVLSAADRDDIVAAILLELVRADANALRCFAGRSSLATYLTVIARRVAVRKLLDRPGTAAAVVAEPAHDPRPAVRDREEVEALLGSLDEAEARLVRLHHLESRSYGEISRITGLPLGSIGPALTKARQKMRAASGDR